MAVRSILYNPLSRATLIVAIGVALSSCMTTAAEHARQLPSESERQMTLGVVQKEIRRGMSQAEVATALGSPNIVTQDQTGLETWVFDKIATEVAYSRSSVSGGAGLLLIGVGASQSAGARSQTQRTLTVVIKFKNALVQDYSYHSSRF